MSFVKFSPGNYIKSSEVNENYDIVRNQSLLAQSDIGLFNATNLNLVGIIGTPYKLLDLFSDSNGTKNTINTTNTTGKYITNGSYYLLSSVVPTGVLEPGLETVTNWSYAESGDTGQITGGQNTDWKTEGTYSYRIRYNGTTDNPTNPTTGGITQSVDFTYIKKLTVDCKFTHSGSGTGSAYRQVLIGSSTYSSSSIAENTVTHNDDSYGSSKNITLRLRSEFGGSGVTWDIAAYFDNLLITPVGRTIESNAQTITGNYSYAFVRPKLYESLSAGSELTAKISLDNGVTWSDEFPINEIYDISALDNDGNLILKLIVNDNGTSEAKLIGWCCLLFE